LAAVKELGSGVAAICLKNSTDIVSPLNAWKSARNKLHALPAVRVGATDKLLSVADLLAAST
jgi:hypothetical protein